MTTTANIAAKGTNGTGITEDLAQTLHNNLGRKVLAVVELVAESRSEKRNGDEKVTLSILTLEPAPTGLTEDHLRDLARSFHYERQLTIEGPTLTGDDGPEPKVADVMASGQRYKPHPYIASTLSTDDNATCDICGSVEAAGVHADRADRAGVDDPFAIPADTDDDPDTDEDDDTDADADEDPEGDDDRGDTAA